jgi:hypothetical protein
MSFMQRINANPALPRFQPVKFLIPAVIFILFILIGVFAFQAAGPRLGGPVLPLAVISQNTLAEKYGLRIDLIGVTAAGGMIDFRMKMIDAQKARLLLADIKNFPVLVAAGGQVLSVPADTRPDAIDFKQDGNLHFIYPNNGGIITPGAAVMVRFGSINIDPIVSR